MIALQAMTLHGIVDSLQPQLDSLRSEIQDVTNEKVDTLAMMLSMHSMGCCAVMPR